MLIDLLETVGGKTDNIALTVVGCIALKKQCHCWICCHHNGYSPSKIIYTIIIMYKHISLLPQCIRGETKYWTKKVKNNTKRDEDCCLCNLFWCWTRWSRVVGACCLQLGIEHSFVWMKDNVAINACAYIYIYVYAREGEERGVNCTCDGMDFAESFGHIGAEWWRYLF